MSRLQLLHSAFWEPCTRWARWRVAEALVAMARLIRAGIEIFQDSAVQKDANFAARSRYPRDSSNVEFDR